MEGLLYLLFSGFFQANKSHVAQRFPLILLQAKVVGLIETLIKRRGSIRMFPLILLQAKAGGDSIGVETKVGGGNLFPLILLQAKAGGNLEAKSSKEVVGSFH